MMSTDVGCVFTFWVDETNMDATDSAMTDIFNAMEQEEFSTGNVKTYTVHRVVDEPGTYIMYEYFTAAGSERHSAGPLMMKAGAQLTSLMVKPYDRVVMEPFHAAGIGEPIAGYRDPNFKPSANDVAVVFTFQAHPLEAEKAELAMADIFAAMEQEEFPTGDVKTYTVHRSDGPGRYIMYEYFTAAGSERHASGPLMQEAGHKLAAQFITPYVRLMMEPVLAVGVGEPIQVEKEADMGKGTKGMTLEAAQSVVAAARKKAEEIQVPMNIAVVDEGNNLTAFARMDGAWLGSIDIAQNKAYTARAFDMETRTLGGVAQPNQPLFGIHASNDGKLIIFAGGIPLVRNGRVIGAIGVSGGTVEQDQEVAEAGLEAL